MTITTLDGIDSGLTMPFMYDKSAANHANSLANRYISTWYLAGNPAAATANSSGLSGVALTNPTTGQLPLPPVSNTTYLASITHKAPNSNSQGLGLLVDRLWHNSGIVMTVSTSQTINSVTWPARDINDSTNGEGVLIGLELSTATGAGTPTMTIEYTNSVGTAGRTSTGIIAGVASSAAGSFYLFALQAGDTGVRSIQTFTFSATWTSGAAHLVAFKVLAAIPARGVNVPGVVHDYMTMGLQKVNDNSVPFVIFAGLTAGKTISKVCYTQG